jgi:hypothetical protein
MPAPTVESNAHNASQGGTTTTIAVNAAGTGRVIIVCVFIGAPSSTVPTAIISSANPAIGAWTSVAATSGVNNGANGRGNGCLLQAWFAVTTGAVSAATVTVTSSVNIDAAGLVYVTVVGAASTPLDQNASLAHGGSLGTSATAWFNTPPTANPSPMSCAVTTTTANVLALTIMGTNVPTSGVLGLQTGTTVVDTAHNAGGALGWAYVDVYSRSFTTSQSATQVGSVGNDPTVVWGTFGFGVTADVVVGIGAQNRVMVLA